MAKMEEGEAVRFLDPETGDNTLAIDVAGKPYTIKLAETTSELKEVKDLDDLAFEGQLGVSMGELEEIRDHGAVIMLRDEQGRLIGESQVVITPMTHHPELSKDEAYNYGSAVMQELQASGIGQILFSAQERVAKLAGKKRSTLTVRPENGLSIRGRFKAGYHITGYNPDQYPEEANSARFIMEKHHADPLEVHHPATLGEEFAVGRGALFVMRQTVELLMTPEPRIIGVPIKVGDEVDEHAREILGLLTEDTHILGLGLLRPHEVDHISEHSVLVLKSDPKSE